jgi:hypothetical protein
MSERRGVVADVIADEHREDDHVRRIPPDVLTQGEELLGRAVATHAEVEDLDASRDEIRQSSASWRCITDTKASS